MEVVDQHILTTRLSSIDPALKDIPFRLVTNLLINRVISLVSPKDVSWES